METSITLPLDEGFLRRQCPSCDREFKWHQGPTDDRPSDFADPAMYHCPYCGLTALVDECQTAEQIEFIQAMVTGPVTREVADEVDEMARRYSGDFIKISVTHDPEPEPPAPLVEPHDMGVVTSPCHPWEPIKITEDWTEAVHCLICGERFAV